MSTVCSFGLAEEAVGIGVLRAADKEQCRASGFTIVGVRIGGTVSDIDPLNKVPF